MAVYDVFPDGISGSWALGRSDVPGTRSGIIGIFAKRDDAEFARDAFTRRDAEDKVLGYEAVSEDYDGTVKPIAELEPSGITATACTGFYALPTGAFTAPSGPAVVFTSPTGWTQIAPPPAEEPRPSQPAATGRRGYEFL